MCKDGECLECMTIDRNQLSDYLDKIARFLIDSGSVKTDDMGQEEIAEYVVEAVTALRERVAWWLENYDITMPCGHKNRYLLTNGRGELEKDFRGDCVCVMCQLEVADEIDAALKSQ